MAKQASKDIEDGIAVADALQADIQADIAEYRENLSLEDLKQYARACDWMQYWRDCPSPLCRRRHRCCGHPYDCFYGRWDRYGDEARAWIEAGMNGLGHGWTARQAANYADRALVSRVKYASGLPHYGPRRRRWRWGTVEREPKDDAAT